MIRITFRRKHKTGRADDWIATSESCEKSGIGKTTDEALASLIGANLATFGIKAMTYEDPTHENPAMCHIEWTAEGSESTP